MKILYKKALFLLCWFVCSTLIAQSNGWNGYQTQNKPNPIVPSTQAPTVSEESRFYLLRTGFLTEGTAMNDGKQYILKTSFGTMSVPIANVEFVGQTLEDIYQYKKSFVDDRNCNDLMKFAEWCFNNQLQQQGITEYQRALSIAPNPVLADVIRKRLESVQNSNIEPGQLSNVQAEPRSADNDADAGLGNWANGIPKPILDNFSKKVQPVLVSRCAAADCHGSNSDNEFKLKIPSHTLGNSTYRNLRAVIQWIDLDYPAESQLLSVLVTPHGAAKPALSVESSQYHNIIQWAQTTAKELPKEYRNQLISQMAIPNSNNKMSADKLPPAIRNAMIDTQPNEKIGKDSYQEIPSTFLSPVQNSDTASITNTMVPPNYSPTSLNLPNIPQAAPMEDPFDPEIFNARYHGTKRRK